MPPKKAVRKAPRPVREAAAATLWASTAASAWRAALDAAPSRARATGVADDPAFYRLGPAMAARAGEGDGEHAIAGLSPADLVTTVSWKLARGTWRPRLLGFAQQASAAEVCAVAKAAAKALANGKASSGPPPMAAVSAAVAALSELKGVGPATATALLTAADDSIPFLSDEASAVVLGKREYTAPAAAALTVALRRRAGELGEGWSARDVERALWSASRAPEVEEGEEGGGGGETAGGGAKKRKR
jgi:hypothetical protein